MGKPGIPVIKKIKNPGLKPGFSLYAWAVKPCNLALVHNSPAYNPTVYNIAVLYTACFSLPFLIFYCWHMRLLRVNIRLPASVFFS